MFVTRNYYQIIWYKINVPTQWILSSALFYFNNIIFFSILLRISRISAKRPIKISTHSYLIDNIFVQEDYIQLNVGESRILGVVAATLQARSGADNSAQKICRGIVWEALLKDQATAAVTCTNAIAARESRTKLVRCDERPEAGRRFIQAGIEVDCRQIDGFQDGARWTVGARQTPARNASRNSRHHIPLIPLQVVLYADGLNVGLKDDRLVQNDDRNVGNVQSLVVSVLVVNINCGHVKSLDRHLVRVKVPQCLAHGHGVQRGQFYCTCLLIPETMGRRHDGRWIQNCAPANLFHAPVPHLINGRVPRHLADITLDAAHDQASHLANHPAHLLAFVDVCVPGTVRHAGVRVRNDAIRLLVAHFTRENSYRFRGQKRGTGDCLPGRIVARGLHSQRVQGQARAVIFETKCRWRRFS